MGGTDNLASGLIGARRTQPILPILLARARLRRLTANGSMNRIAFDVASEKMEEYRERSRGEGNRRTEIVNHDKSPMQMSKEVTDDVFDRSMYFFDPDGVMLELVARTRDLRPDEAEHTAATAADGDRYLGVQEQFAERIAAAQRKKK